MELFVSYYKCVQILLYKTRSNARTHSQAKQERSGFFLLSVTIGKFLPSFPFVHKLRDYTGMHKQLQSKTYVTKVILKKSETWERRDSLTEQFRDRESHLIC